jgi:hypothetical protein
MERLMTDRLLARRAARALVTLALGAAPALGLAGPAVSFSGSAYVDSWIVPGKTAAAIHGTTGITTDGSIKLSVDINENLSFSAKACLSCHGVEFENASLDFQPKTWFNAQIGRIAVPFGEYSNRVDPSGHKTASAPLIYDMGRMAYGDRANFNGPVIMLPYVDTGVLLYGQFFIGSRVQVWYGGYGVAGLKGAADVEWISMRSVPYTDNNRLPSYGGRIATTLVTDPGGLIGDASLGVSYTGGRFDKDANLQYDAAAVDATLPIWVLTLRGEYALRRTHLDPKIQGYGYAVVDPFFDKKGFYVELEHPLGPYLAMVYRYDQLARVGVPLPGSAAALSPNSRIDRYTGGVVITPVSSLYVKLSYEFWKPTDYDSFHSVHVGVGGAF